MLEAETPDHLNLTLNPEFVRMDSKVTPITAASGIIMQQVYNGDRTTTPAFCQY